MKIFVVSQSFHPDTFLINDTVKTLTERGHEVTVLTGLPDYRTSYIPAEYRNGQKRHERFHGAEVYRVATIARRKGPLFRSLNYLSFVFSANRFISRHDLSDYDLIYVWQVSPVTMGLPAIKAKKLYRKPVLLYCLDIWPECVKAMGFREGTIFYKIINIISAHVYSRCDRIAVSSKPFREYLHEADGIAYEKMSYLPQFAPEMIMKEDLVKEPDGKTDLLFAGNIGKAQDMACLLKALALLKDRDDIHVDLVGGGSMLEESRSLCSKYHLDDMVAFHGPRSYEETLPFYRKADACILTLDGSNRIGDTLPGKLQTYMAAGKPVIAAINGAGRQVIEESGCGLCVAAGDHEGLARIIEEYADHKESFADCGRKGREYFIANFREDIHMEKLEQLMAEVVR